MRRASNTCSATARLRRRPSSSGEADSRGSARPRRQPRPVAPAPVATATFLCKPWQVLRLLAGRQSLVLGLLPGCCCLAALGRGHGPRASTASGLTRLRFFFVASPCSLGNLLRNCRPYCSLGNLHCALACIDCDACIICSIVACVPHIHALRQAESDLFLLQWHRCNTAAA